jgi:hypothetical protein
VNNYWLTQYALSAIGLGYLFVVLAAAVLALWLPEGRKAKVVWTFVVVGLASFLPVRAYLAERDAANEYRAKLVKARALFDERCKTAGEKVYKTVDNVEAVRLINPRPKRLPGDDADQNWSGAGLAHESTGSQYIANFLYYDIARDGNFARTLSPGGTPGPFGSIAAGVAPKGQRGFRYIEIETNGVRSRYSLRSLSSYESKGDPLEAFVKREQIAAMSARYSVSYEDIQDPVARANWIAGARVRVQDQQRGELLGELIQFNFESGFGSRAGARQPWAFAEQCPANDPIDGRIGAIRFFAQKILKPARSE